ncbi:MAG: MATE family efflux transporter [Flavobacteriales bacterium]
MAQEKNSRLRDIYNIVKLSLNGEEQDYTQGSIRKAVFLLAIPMILELSLESVFAVVDMFFVGKLGANAIATVAYTESVAMIIYSVAIGLSTGATAIVARRIGEKDPVAAAEAGVQSLILALIISVIIGAAGLIFAPEILDMMGASDAVIAEGTVFTRIMLGGSLVIVLLFLINGIFRGAGNAAMAMKSLWIASLINIILCPLLINIFGLKGAAIATVIGRGTGIFYQCYHLFKGSGILKIKTSHFKVDGTLVKSILNIAWPATFQFIIASGSWIVLTRLVADVGGTDASAGYQVAFRNVVFFILPAWGLSNAAATLVGQNLGAKQLERAEKSVLLATKYNIIFMTFVTLLFALFAEPIVRFYTEDPVIVEYATTVLRIMGAGFIFFGTSMVMTQALNGAGDTKTPTVINFVCFWLFQIPLAYILSKGFDMGATGVVLAVPIAEVLIAGVSWYFFRKGKWKEVKL